MDLLIELNGQTVSDSVEAHQLLVQFLRVDRGLTGTKIGCETSYCGACTVLVNGRAVKSCSMLTIQADGCTVVTIEGLGSADRRHVVQECFSVHHALQCGYCTPGMVMAAVAILDENPSPTRHEIREALDGNLCRCTGYETIVNAIHDAGGRLRGEPPALPEWTAENPRAGEGART